MDLDDKVVLIRDQLTTAGIEHAFGGALALAYHGEPRATDDIDVNLHVDPTRAGEIVALLRALGCKPPRDPHVMNVTGQARLWWDRHPVDIFFDVSDYHEGIWKRTRLVPFGGGHMRILGPEDLLIFKTLYDRRKDWLDIEQMLFAAGDAFDIDYVHAWIDELIGPEDARSVELRACIDRIRG